MPRGGHKGLWKPTPLDFFRSRWKRFYKRSYRPRSGGANNPDWLPPHPQATYNNDGVPSPWKLQYSLRNFPPGSFPPDARGFAQQAYEQNFFKLMQPYRRCTDPVAMDIVMRCLDPGRHGGGDTGYGRTEVEPTLAQSADVDQSSKGVPQHLYNMLGASGDESDQQFYNTLKTTSSDPDTFHIHRLRELCEEKQIVYLAGKKPDFNRNQGNESDHRFPFVDEQAGLLDELNLKDILRLRYKTNSRRHPKWTAIKETYKRWHRLYLRNKAVLEDEAKARLGVKKQQLT